MKSTGWRRDVFVAILLLNSIAASATVLLTPRVESVPTEVVLGLVAVAPPGFWVGFTLSLVAVIVSISRSRGVFACAATTAFATWYGLPTLILANPYRLDASAMAALVGGLSISGRIDFARVGQSYLQFPGFIILGVQTVDTTGMLSVELAKWSTLLWSGSFLVAFHSLCVRMLGDNRNSRVAVLIGAFGSVWLQFHFVPQAAGVILVVLTLWVLHIKGTGSLMCALLMGTWLAVAHPPSILFLLCALSASWLLSKISSGSVLGFGVRRTDGSPRDMDMSPTMLGAVAALWVAWIVFVATATFSSSVRLVTNYLISEGNLGSPRATLARSLLTSEIRGAYLLLLVGFEVAFVVYLVLQKNKGSAFRISLGWLAAAGAFGIVVYPTYLLDRAYMFYVLGAAISFGFIAIILGRSRTVRLFVVVVLVATAACAATAYRDTALYVVPPHWAGPSAFDFRTLNEYPKLPCSKPFVTYVDNFTLLWTAARLGSDAAALQLQLSYLGGSVIYADGTTTGYFQDCNSWGR